MAIGMAFRKSMCIIHEMMSDNICGAMKEDKMILCNVEAPKYDA